jgi:hypothetical protein
VAETIKDFEQRFGKLAEHSTTFDRGMTHSALSLKNLVTSIFLGENALRGWNAAASRSTWLKGVDTAARTLASSASDLVKEYRNQTTELSRQEMLTNGLIDLEEGQVRLSQFELDNLRAQLNVTEKKVNLAKVLERTSGLSLALITLTTTALGSAYSAYQRITDTLIEGNSALAARFKLTASIMNVNRELGTSLELSVESARALVEYGYDLDTAFESSLKLVNQLHDGIGMSVKQSAELVAVYDRQLKAPVREVADAIARVVQDTGLAANEAGRLAVNLGRAMATLRPGLSKDFGAVNELVGRYEGALQELGGQFGAFGDLLSKMTSQEGMMQAGILGVNNPAFLASKDATKQVIDSFAQYAKNFLGNADGWDRALRLQALGEMFGTTAAQANLMVQAIDRQNSQVKSSIDLEERYREQLRTSGKALDRLKNSFVGLIQQGAIPLLQALAPMAGFVADVLEAVVHLKAAVPIMTGAIVLGSVLLVNRLFAVARAFLMVAAAAHASAIASRAKALADAGQLSLPGLAGGGVTGMSGRLASMGRSFGAVAGPMIAAALVAVLAFQLGRALKERYADITFNQTALRANASQVLEMTLKKAAVTGDLKGYQESLIRARGALMKEGYSHAQANAIIANKIQKSSEVIGRMRYTKMSAESSFEPSHGETPELEELNSRQAKLVTIAEEQRDNAIKTREIEEKHFQHVKEKSEADERNSLLRQAHDVLNDIYRPAFEQWNQWLFK